MVVRVRHKGQITLPAEVREAADLDEGVELDVSVHGREIVLRPAGAAYGPNGNVSSVFSESLQERLERALAEVEAGNVIRYEDNESFLNSFD